MAGRRKFKVEVDARTDVMPMQVLECRESNHAWTRLPASPKRRVELDRLGQEETVRRCIRCSTARIDLYEIPSFDLLSRRYEYVEDYLLQEPGALSKGQVRAAMYVRDRESPAAATAA